MRYIWISQNLKSVEAVARLYGKDCMVDAFAVLCAKQIFMKGGVKDEGLSVYNLH